MAIQAQQEKELKEHNDAVRVQKADSKPVYTIEDAAHFKNVLLQLICKGEANEVEELLHNAPSFNDFP